MKKIVNMYRMPLVIFGIIVLSFAFIVTIKILADDPANGGKKAEIENVEKASNPNDINCNKTETQGKCYIADDCGKGGGSGGGSGEPSNPPSGPDDPNPPCPCSDDSDSPSSNGDTGNDCPRP